MESHLRSCKWVIYFISNTECCTKEYRLSPKSISLPIVPFFLISILSVTTSSCIILDSSSAFWSYPIVNINIYCAFVLFVAILLKLIKHCFSSFRSQTIFQVTIWLKIIPGSSFSDEISIASNARLVVNFLHTELK